jgi:hypothetical protein
MKKPIRKSHFLNGGERLRDGRGQFSRDTAQMMG